MDHRVQLQRKQWCVRAPEDWHKHDRMAVTETGQ